MIKPTYNLKGEDWNANDELETSESETENDFFDDE